MFNFGTNILYLPGEKDLYFKSDQVQEPCFDAFIDGTSANVIAVQSDDKLIAAGRILFGRNIIRLNTDGTEDFSFVTTLNGDTHSIAIDSAGKIYVGGFFTLVNGVTALNRIVRLNTDGTVDSGFNIGTGFNAGMRENVIKIDGSGKIVVGGTWTTYNGIAARRIIRLNTDGSIDGSFVYGTAFNNQTTSITIDSSGRILIGGSFTTYKGLAATRIIRLNPDGSVDGTFVTGTGFNNTVLEIKEDNTGKILIGGSFTLYKGAAANRIIRLNTDGSVDTSFVTGTGFNTGQVFGFKIAGGKILVAGNFTSYNGTPTPGLARLNSDGSIDGTFAFGTGFNVLSIGVGIDSKNKIFFGGNFSFYKGVAVGRVVKLSYNGDLLNC